MSITDVRGIRVGHWTDERAHTGCTVVLADEGARGGVDVRGGAPGTLGTDLLRPLSAQPTIDAIVLAGGSAFGLAAVDGVMRYLEERGRGLHIAEAIVPLVAAAVIFDLRDRDTRVRPNAASGYAACAAASSDPPAEGRVGAGTGATIGKLFGPPRPGGLGTASRRVGGVTVGALFVVNAVGDVVADGAARRAVPAGPAAPGAHTTIGVVATDAALTKVEANLLARVAHDGIAIAVHPAHTQRDGDTTFAIATGQAGEADLVALQMAAVEATVEAIRRAVR